MKRLGWRNAGGQLHAIVTAGIEHLGDFTTSPRVLLIAAIALVVGTAGVVAGVVLLDLITLVTNLAYFGRFTLAPLDLGHSPLGVAAVAVPVAGALIIGLMARYGSEKIRGHGIIQQMQHPGGTLRMPTFPVRFDGAPPKIKRSRR